MNDFDVVVVGGGPAGLAVAGALRLRGHAVALYEKTAYQTRRAGESLGAEAFALLRTIGAWSHVEPVLESEVPFRGVRSAWGSDELDERPSLFNAHGEGRHVDRARFDQALAAWAESTGVTVRREAGACVVVPGEQGFRIEPMRGEGARARYVVDASGRGAPAGARLVGRHWLALDRQVALVGRMRSPHDLGCDLVLEAAEHGWWYSVPQASGELVVVLITDADLVLHGARATLGERFTAALAQTRHTAERCAGLALDPAIRVVRADSGRLVPDHGPGWCAVGDAAIASDPLAGNGVIRALRGAVEATERIDAHLAGRPTPAASKTDARFLDYLERRAEYYGMETRWPAAPFWARRRAPDWRHAPITLAPTALLRRGGDVGRTDLAAVEALLPPRAIAHALATVTGATPAHVLLRVLRDDAPLGDLRLLVGLQLLIASGALALA